MGRDVGGGESGVRQGASVVSVGRARGDSDEGRPGSGLVAAEEEEGRRGGHDRGRGREEGLVGDGGALLICFCDMSQTILR